MEDTIQFDNQGEEFGQPPQRTGSDLTGKLIQWGLVSDRKQAEFAMAGAAVLIFIIAFIVYRSTA